MGQSGSRDGGAQRRRARETDDRPRILETSIPVLIKISIMHNELEGDDGESCILVVKFFLHHG